MSEWKKVKLREVLKEVNERNKGEKVKRVLSVTNSQGFMNQEEYFEGTVHSANISNYKIVRKNQFAYNPSRVNVGSIDILKDYEDGALSPMYVIFEVDKTQLLPEYFKYYFQTNRFYENVKNNTQGSVRNSLSFKALSDFDYLLPPIEEQEKIVMILNKLDKNIGNINFLIKYIDKYKHELLKNIFREKIRVNNINNEKWKINTIENVCDIKTGNGNTQDKNDNGIYPFFVRSPIVEHSNKYTYDTEAVLTAGDGVGTGKVFHYVNGKFYCHQRVYAMMNFKGVTAKFFYYYFSENFLERVKKMSAKNSVDSVRKEMISKMLIKIPKIEEQKIIVNIAEKYNKKIDLLNKKIEYLENLKKGLMQKLLTGKVRVKI